MSEVIELTEEQLEALEIFVFKVSMDGYAYAIENYPPKELPKSIYSQLRTLPSIEAENYLEELMEEYGLEYS